MKRAVKQRNGSDCAIAAVANAVGTSYAAVRRAYPDSVRGGLEDGDIDYLAGQFGDWRYTNCRKYVELDYWLRRHREGRYVLVISTGFFGVTDHAVAVIDGRVVGEYTPTWNVSSYWRLLSLKNSPDSR